MITRPYTHLVTSRANARDELLQSEFLYRWLKDFWRVMGDADSVSDRGPFQSSRRHLSRTLQAFWGKVYRRPTTRRLRCQVHWAYSRAEPIGIRSITHNWGKHPLTYTNPRWVQAIGRCYHRERQRPVTFLADIGNRVLRVAAESLGRP